MANRRIPGFLSSLSEWLSGSAAVAGGEREDAESSGSPRAERPVGRSIVWVPRGTGTYDVERPRRYDLFVEQNILREVCDHALEEVEGSYGLLAGRLLRCSRTRLPYVHVESAHRADHALPTDEDLASFREFFWKVRGRVSRRERQVVGWYHTHSLLGLQLSDRDRRLHVAHFQEVWACAFVVVTQRGRQEGGFFQRDRGDILFRRAILPFYEVIKQKVRPGGGPYVTWSTWDNYRTGVPVLHARKPVTVRPAASADASTTKLLTRERARGPRWKMLPKEVPEAPRGARRKLFGATGRPPVRKASAAARGSGRRAAWQEWKEGAAARLAAKEEAARLAAEEAARLAAEEEATRQAAARWAEAARLAAEEEAARQAAGEEAARLAAADAGLAASGAAAAGAVLDPTPSLQETMSEEPEAPPAEELPVDVPDEVADAPPALAAEQVEPEGDRRPADAALAELKERAAAEPALDQRGEVASVDQGETEAVPPLRAAVPVDEDEELVMPPLVMPEPLPAGLNLRRYAPGIGIGLVLATLAAWLLLGG